MTGAVDVRPSRRASQENVRSERSPEVELLICCARTRTTEESRQRMRELLRERVEWSKLRPLASRHRMFPLLTHHLRAVADAVPPEEMERLAQIAVRHAGVVLALTHELVHVLRLLRDHGVLAVPYKGIVLAHQLYGNYALRQAGDLDLLVRKEDVPKARALLLERDYSHGHDLTPANVAFRLSRRYCEDFESPKGIHLELHWAFTNKDIVFPLTLDDVAPRLRTFVLGPDEILVFSPEDLLQILCVHGAKHRWDRLEWICGVSELLRSERSLDWKGVLDSAATLHSTRMLLLGVFLAHAVLGAPVPQEVMERARRDRWVVRLATDVQSRLDLDTSHIDPVEDVLSNNLFQLPLQERAWDRVRFLFYRFTTPNRAADWRTVSWGPITIPVHSITWPVRLGAKLVKRPFAHLLRRDSQAKVVA